MGLQKKSLQRRFASFLRRVRPSMADRMRRFRERILLPGFLPLSYRQAGPVVMQLGELVRSLWGETKSPRLRGASGMSARFALRVERLEARQLLSASPLYVAHLAADPTPGNNYWVIDVSGAPTGGAVTASTPAGTLVDSADGLVMGQSWQATAFNVVSDALNAATGGTAAAPVAVDILPGAYQSGLINVTNSYVTIEGDASATLGTTIVASNGVFNIGAVNVTVNNLVVTGGATSSNPGIAVTSNGSNFTIQNSLFKGNAIGVQVAGSGTISGDTFDGSSYNSIAQSQGVLVTGSDGGSVAFSGDTFENQNQGGAAGLSVQGGTVSLTGSLNTFTGNTCGILVTGGSVTAASDCVSASSNVDGVRISGGTLSLASTSLGSIGSPNTEAGVNVLGGSVTLSTNQIVGNAVGVLASGGNVTISSNSILSNIAYGIEITGGTVGLSGNTVARTASGIGVGVSGGSATASQDTIYSNSIGIQVSGSAAATLSGEYVFRNSAIGIDAGSGGGNVSISGTNFYNSTASNATDLQLESGAIGVSLGASNAFYAATNYIANYSTQPLNVTGDTFDVNGPSGTQVAGSSLTVAQGYAVAEQIVDALDNPGNGFVRIQSGSIFVTPVAAAINANVIATAQGIAAADSVPDTIDIDATNSLSGTSTSIQYGATPTTLTATVTGTWAALPAGSSLAPASPFAPAGSFTIAPQWTDAQSSGNLSGGTFSGQFASGAIAASSTPYSINYGFAAATAIANGTLNYTLDGNSNSNSPSVTGTLTVNPAVLNYTIGNDGQSYGSPANLAADLGTTIAGVNGETLDIAYSSAGDTAAAAVGTYAITGLVTSGTGLASNYTVNLSSGVLTVNPATANVTVTPYSVTYDGSPHTATAVATGVGGANLANSVTLNTAHTNAGTYAADSWSFSYPNYVSQSGTITDVIAERAITVTANSGQSKVYGQSDPATFTYAVTSGSLVQGDSLSGALGRVAGETAGPYAMTQGSLTAGANYSLTYVPANFTINPPTLTPSGNSSINEGSTYSLTLGAVPTTFAAAGDSTWFIVVNWSDPSNDPNLVPGGTNEGQVFVASPSGSATGDGSGKDAADLMAFPAGGVLTHVYTDATALSKSVVIGVDLVTTNHIDFSMAGGKTITILDVAPTTYLGGNSPVQIGNTSFVYQYDTTNPSPEARAAGFHYVYQLYYNGQLEWAQGSTASYSSGVANSTLTIPANYLEAPGVTVVAYAIDKNGGVSSVVALPIEVDNNNSLFSVAVGGNLTATAGVAFSQSVTFNYPDSSGLSPYTAYLYQQGNPTPLATVGNVQPGVAFNIGATFSSANTYTCYVAVSDTAGAAGTSANFQVNVVNPVLRVVAFNPSVCGFSVTFNVPVNANLLSLYDGLIEGSVVPGSQGVNTSAGAPSVTLVGQNVGVVHGSLVWNAATDSATFVANSIAQNGVYTTISNGLLPPDNYTVTLLSPAAPPSVHGTVGINSNPNIHPNTTTTFSPTGYSGAIPTGGYMLVGGATERYYWNSITGVVTINPPLPSAPSVGTPWSIVTGGWQTAGELPLNGAYGSSYTTTFTVAPSNAVVLSVPSFARGANQGLNVEDNGTAGTGFVRSPGTAASGLPIRISNGAGVTAVDFTLTYDPTLITITGVARASGVPSDWGVVFNKNTPGTLIVSAFGTTSLPTGNSDVVDILGSVVSTAPYGASELLTLSNIAINGGQIAVAGNYQAVHKAAYFGDSNGNVSLALNYYDPVDISRVVAKLDTGYFAYPLTDPLIIGDVTGDGTLSSLDASYVAQVGVGINVPEIPAVPTTTPPASTGPDPTITIPSGLVGIRGRTVTSTVSVDNTQGFTGIGASLDYPSVVTLDPTQVTLSSYLSYSGFGFAANSPSAGQLNIEIYTLGGALNDGPQALFNMPFVVRQNAANGTIPIGFSTVSGGNLTFTQVNGNLVINGYNWIGGAGASGHVNDWSVTGNWDANLDPNAAGTAVIFGNAGTSGTAVLTSNRTVGTITFLADTPTTLSSAGGALTLDNGANDATISASGSGHNITSQLGVRLNCSVDITVIANGDSLAIAGNISDGANGHEGITKNGDGKLILSGHNTYGGSTVVARGVLTATSPTALPDGGALVVGSAGIFSNAATRAGHATASVVTQTEPAIPTEVPRALGLPTKAFVQATSLQSAGVNFASLLSSRIAARLSATNDGSSPAAGAGGTPQPGHTGIKARDAALAAWIVARSAAGLTCPATDLTWLKAESLSAKESRDKRTAVDEAILAYLG